MRAVQRAFRQRKEGYIKKLEQQVRDFSDMEGKFNAIQLENMHLKEYVLNLQSKLLDVKAECPPPPPTINLNPHAPHQTLLPASASSGGGNAAMPPAENPLAQVAQAVAQFDAAKGYGANDDARTAEAISRQLQADRADGLPAAPM